MIKLQDKYFEPVIPQEQIESRIAELAGMIDKDYEGQTIHLLVILSGAFRFGAELCSRMRSMLTLNFAKLCSYDGTHPGMIRPQLDIPDMAGKNVLVVEDIVDTGSTLRYILEHASLKNAAAVKVASLLFKPEALKHDLNIDYTGFRIPNAFVVGYGLDYCDLGRNLNDIYQLKPNP